ncbi:MAG: histidine kinase N-terminal 7TM domain-containing protein, partial [Candidatus Omnitrophota bacterium]
MIPHLKIAAVLMTITAFSMALFIFAKGWKNKENLLWILFNVCVVLYSSGLFFSEVPINDIHRSYLWWRFAYLGIIFIPTIYYHFMTVVVGMERKRRFLISFFYADCFIFLFLNFLTPWFFTEKGLRYVLGRFYIVDSNPVWNVFLAMWIIQVLASMIEAILQYRYLPKAKQDQLKYVIIGMIISYAGGVTNYLPCFHFEVYPYGVYLVPVYIILTSYAIIRYRFMEIDTVVHKTILWMTTSLWLIIPAYILFKITRQWIREMSTLWLTIFALAAFYVFLSYYRYFQPKIDHFFRRRKYDYQTILGKVAEKIATSINIEELARNLLTEICEIMYLRNSLLYILARNEMKYLVIGKKG